jgi:hypothetical protein
MSDGANKLVGYGGFHGHGCERLLLWGLSKIQLLWARDTRHIADAKTMTGHVHIVNDVVGFCGDVSR